MSSGYRRPPARGRAAFLPAVRCDDGNQDVPAGCWQAFVAELPARTAKLGIVRADASAHVAPVWVGLAGDTIVFMTSAETIKSKAILRDPRVRPRPTAAATPFPPLMVVRVTPTKVVARSTSPVDVGTRAHRGLLRWDVTARQTGSIDFDDRQPILSEEFLSTAGAAPDRSLWRAEIGGGGWGCEQRQIYTDDRSNVSITAEDQLAITARRSPDGTMTSARLTTKDRFAVQYGLVEARMKVPGGLGTWPAFWMLGVDIDEVGWPACGEIDVMEHVGSDPAAVHGTVHGPGYAGLSGGIGVRHQVPSALSEEFHVYGVDWSADRITWLLDGRPYHHMTPERTPGARWPFRHPFFIVVNLAVGGAWPGNDSETPPLPATLLVDWIRVRSSGATR